MKAAGLLLLCFALPWHAACSQTPQVAFQLAPPRYPRSQSVQAANGSIWADTPQSIDKINLRLARRGNTEAAFQLGLAYMQGFGVPQNIAEADKWISLGAATPDKKAWVGDLYEDGTYLPPSATEAARWLTAAGRPIDLFELAEMYRNAQPSQATTAAALYRRLLKMPDAAEARMAMLKLGELVLNGQYSAGADPQAQTLNLQWARSIAQELLGQSEYYIAVDYLIGRDGIPVDQVMWARFCARAAAYNIDLAQQFYAEAILSHEIVDADPLEGYAWLRLASDKQFANRAAVAALEAKMDPPTRLRAEEVLQTLLATRLKDGAYYRRVDPLRNFSEATLHDLPADDPDAEIRRAFALESCNTFTAYEQALDLYRKVRDTSWMAAMAVLGRDYMSGTAASHRTPPSPAAGSSVPSKPAITQPLSPSPNGTAVKAGALQTRCRPSPGP